MDRRAASYSKLHPGCEIFEARARIRRGGGAPSGELLLQGGIGGGEDGDGDRAGVGGPGAPMAWVPTGTPLASAQC